MELIKIKGQGNKTLDRDWTLYKGRLMPLDTSDTEKVHIDIIDLLSKKLENETEEEKELRNKEMDERRTKYLSERMNDSLNLIPNEKFETILTNALKQPAFTKNEDISSLSLNEKIEFGKYLEVKYCILGSSIKNFETQILSEDNSLIDFTLSLYIDTIKTMVDISEGKIPSLD